MRIVRPGQAPDDTGAGEPARGEARTITVTLTRHPDTPSAAVRGIEACVARHPDGTLDLAYTLTGTLAIVLVPAPRAPRMGERLWEHTCFELFVRIKDKAPYHELNFAPSGEWAALAFQGYRVGGVLPDKRLDPKIRARSDASSLTLQATVRLGLLSPLYVGATLTLGLSAVIEECDGTLSYWALGYPTGKPDFHHHKAFALEFDEARD